MHNLGLKYYSQSYLKAHNASVKPRTDFEYVLNLLNATPVGLKSRIFSLRIVYKIYAILNFIISWILMPKGRIVTFQYPFQIGIKQMFNRAKRRGNRTCLLVHDLEELRPINHDPYSSLLTGADFLIVHTNAMAEWLKDHHNIKGDVVILNLFDYINFDEFANGLSSRGFNRPLKVAFCGNLEKSAFLSQLEIPEHINLVIYGLNCPEGLIKNPRVDYRGVANPDRLPELIADCDFGLVWDGADANSMIELQGLYLRYNAPHKVSLYLSSGLPVLIWNKMGISNFILSHQVGICGINVYDLFDKLKNIDNNTIHSLKNNSRIIGERLRKGGMYEAAIMEVISMANKI